MLASVGTALLVVVTLAEIGFALWLLIRGQVRSLTRSASAKADLSALDLELGRAAVPVVRASRSMPQRDRPSRTAHCAGAEPVIQANVAGRLQEPAAVAQPHARRTSRLQGLVRCLALALGGRPAEALGHRLLLPVSKDTFLRSLRSAPENDAAAPHVIGRDHLCKADAIQVAQIEAELPGLASARRLTDRFTEMVRNGREEALAVWLDEAEGSMIASFARGLRSDQKAVAAALREPWSN